MSWRASLAASENSPITLRDVREQALKLGWDDVGITRAEIPKADIQAYKVWLEDGFHGDLAYMEKEIRCYPEKLLPGAKSAILFISYYKQEPQPFRKDAGLIASYARGRKYHNVHHARLKKFIAWLEEKAGKRQIAKGFSDSSPLLEKALAVQAGLGWFGKNTLLIHPKFGTFTLLSGILTTLEFTETVTAMRLPRCGSCTRCLDACPTQALVSPYRLDARKCLSYHLIESKKPLPEEIHSKNPGNLFGCDICQDVCPHNARKKASTSEDFSPQSGLGSYLTQQQLADIAKKPESLYGTPLQRRGVAGLLHTAETLVDFSGVACPSGATRSLGIESNFLSSPGEA